MYRPAPGLCKFLPMHFLLLLGLLAAPSLVAAPPQFPESIPEVRHAIFSPRQLFWPQLAQSPPPAARPKTNQAKRGRTAASLPGGQVAPARIGVLPITVRDYKESLECDSCHRLSPNGMEFFLENYFKDRLHTRFPDAQVELVAPHFSLLQSGKINLAAYLDSLQWPWDRWFAGDPPPLVYRPRDWMTAPTARRRMDRLGGQLGMTHLLLCSQVWVRVFPKRSDTHEGALEWGFRLVFWDVAGGRPEWALTFSEKVPYMDLDKSLEAHLDRGLVPVWDHLPVQLQALWKAEPR
jgi:hypothetical protein